MNTTITMMHPLLRFSLIALLLIVIGAAAPAQKKLPSSATLNQRAKDAAAQLRLIEARSAARTAERGMLPFGARADVGISVRKDLATASTIYFYDDMESGLNGWTTDMHGDTTAAWHLTTLNANSPTHSWWAGVEASGTYNTNHRVQADLISPSINLTSAAGPVSLLFTENYATESGWDFCMVDVSTNAGASWTHLRGGYASSVSGSSDGWRISSEDLSAYAGTTINLRFSFDTGDSLWNAFPGWFVDNVVVFDHSATISGTIYFDWNQNGILEESEVRLQHHLARATGPVTITGETDASGSFTYPLPLGSYDVTEVISSPWTQTAPPGDVWHVNLVNPGELVSGLEFGDWRPGTIITGSAFDDINRDSVRNIGDTALAHHTVLLYFGSPYPQTALTDSLGVYSFVVFSTGTYQVVDHLFGGRVSSLPGGPGSYSVPVASMGQVISGLDFGSFQLANNSSISGFAYNDLDHNGTFEAHEGVMAGFTAVCRIGDTYFYSPVDDSGHFAFDGLLPGIYQVYLSLDYTWRQSEPDTTLTVVLGESQSVTGTAIGVYRLPLGSIAGVAFHDLNRNGVRDSGEAVLPNWTVSTTGPEPAEYNGRRWGTTDSTGRYIFSNYLTGAHTVYPDVPLHWRTALPDGGLAVTLADNQNRDSADVGSYLLSTGSIAGTVFNDQNGNGVRDPGEPGLSGWNITLSGDQSGSFVSNDTGLFSFGGLWAGSYKLINDLRAHWRQTLPDSLRPRFVALGDEANPAGEDFGVTFDTAFTLSFRTFLPESLSLARNQLGKLAKIVDVKPYYTVFRFAFVNVGTTPATSLTFGLGAVPKDIAMSASVGVLGPGPKARYRIVTFTPPLQGGDSVVISGVYRGRKPETSGFTSFTNGDAAWVARVDQLLNLVMFPMPNALNALSAGAGTMLRVGLGGPHSVVHPSYKDVIKSMIDVHGGPVVGPATCIGKFSTNLKPVTKQQKSIPPTKMNNIMFSEAIAFKANLKASELWITPPGLGKLIYEDTTDSPYNGMSLNAIAAKVDSDMSAYDIRDRLHPTGGDSCLCTMAHFDSLWHVIRSIDSAFSGPIDTVSFSRGLVFTPVRSLNDVPFLHLDSAFAAMGTMAVRPTPPGSIPEQFALNQNYPNPFNPSTTIEFNLPMESFVTITLYNTLGQVVALILNREQVGEGWSSVDFSADHYGLASGVYYYRISAESIGEDETPGGVKFTAVRKMMYLK